MIQYGKLPRQIAEVMASENGALAVPSQERKEQLLKQYPECPENKIVVWPRPKEREWVEGVNYFIDEIYPTPSPSEDK